MSNMSKDAVDAAEQSGGVRWPLVPRTQAIGRLDAALRNRVEDDTAAAICNIHGTAGIGKTTLLRHYFERLASSGAPVILLEFEAASTGGPERPTNWDEVIEILRKRIPILADLPDTITASQGGTLPAQEVEVGYASAHLERIAEQKLRVLLDGLHTIWYWKWLQSELVRPLVEEARTRIICSSRSPIFWHYWELREQCEVYELPPFSPGETTEVLEGLGGEAMSQVAHELTLGYAPAIGRLYDLVSHARQPFPGLTDSTPATEFWADLSAETRQYMPYIGHMRQVDAGIIQCVLAGSFPEFAEGRPDALKRTHNILRELARTGYTDLTSLDQTRFVAEHRYQLIAYQRVFDRQTFIEACCRLGDIYFEVFQESSSSNYQAFANWLYFAVLGSTSQPEAVGEPSWVGTLQEAFELTGSTFAPSASQYTISRSTADVPPGLPRLQHHTIGAHSVAIIAHSMIGVARDFPRLSLLDTLYDDGELLDLLCTTGSYPRFAEIVRDGYSRWLKEWSIESSFPTMLPISRGAHASFFERLVRDLVVELPERLNGLVDDILAAAYMLNPSWTFGELVDQITKRNEQRAIPRQAILELITSMCSNGLCEYEQNEDRYRLKPVLGHFVACRVLFGYSPIEPQHRFPTSDVESVTTGAVASVRPLVWTQSGLTLAKPDR